MDSALNELVMKPFSWRLMRVTSTYRIGADKAEPRLVSKGLVMVPKDFLFSICDQTAKTSMLVRAEERRGVCR